MPSISAIVPTVATDLARLTLLRRSMESAYHQLSAGDELLIAADTTDGPLDAVRELCLRFDVDAIPFGFRVRYVPHAGEHGHTFGHDQINAAMAVATGDYLTFNDDDDIYCAGAFDAIRERAEALPHPAPLLFRFRSYHGPVFWVMPGLLGQGLIGGHCAVVPNLPSLLGQWGAHYEGDWTFIESTLALWANVGVAPVWVDRLIAIARP